MSTRSADRGTAAAKSVRLAPRSLSIVATGRASLPRCVLRFRGSGRPSSASIPAASRTIPLTPTPTRSSRAACSTLDRQRQRNSGMVSVAHRLSALVQASAILLLEQGRLVDCAPHPVLLERCAIYRHLWQ